MQQRTVTELTTEPVTLDEAKAQVVLDLGITADDDLLNKKISAARQYLEEYTGLAFGEKTIEVYFDSEDTDLSLPVGPVIGSITSVVRTVNNDTTTLTTSDYTVQGLSFKKLSFLPVWTSCGRANTAHLVTYQAGYNTTNPFPPLLKEALLKLIAELYRDRENSISGTINTLLPHHVRALASPFCRNVWL